MFRLLSIVLVTLTVGVASLGAQATAPTQASPTAPPPASMKSTTSSSRMAPVNLNTATAAQLEALPGIGKSTAERILAYRQKNGSFKKTEDVMNVRGVGEKSFLKLKPLLTVGPAKSAATPE